MEPGKLEVLKGGLFSLLLFAAGSNPIYYAVNGGVGRLPKIVEIALLPVVFLPILLGLAFVILFLILCHLPPHFLDLLHNFLRVQVGVQLL